MNITGQNTQAEKITKEIKTVDQVFFVTGLICTAVAVFCYGWWKITGKSILPPFPPCMIHAVTGLYCPGCGGTRAVLALVRGKLLASFFYHPIVLYTAVVGGWFLLSQTIGKLSRGRFPAVMHFKPGYLWIALALVVINCIAKNVALLCFQIRRL